VSHEIPPLTVSVAADDGVDFSDVVRFIWRHRFVIALACFCCGVIAVALALTATPIYRAEVVVTEVHDRNMTGVGSLATQLGGIASLAGVELTPGANPSQEAEAVLESRRLVEEFIKRGNLLPVLSRRGSKPSTLWIAVRQFKEGVVSVRKDMRKGVTTVAMEWTDAATAANWANEFVALANELIRRRALDESGRNIAYLNEQIARTNDVELRRVMYNLIENETRTLMLANARAEYAFEVVDPAVPPEIRTRPHRALMVLVGVALGFVPGVIAALVIDQRRSRRRAAVAGLTTSPI
jgi:uncharacterized protein involved in exopolysaccharide biosynthesis